MAQGFGKELYKMEGHKSKVVMEYLEVLSFNPSHRWIPFDMIAVLDHILATERQCQWLVTMVKVKVKKDISFTRVLRTQS